jgi:hypothetical protein
MAHFPVASLTQVVLLLVFICWTKSSTGAAFSMEEEFLQLKENYVRINLNFLFTREAFDFDSPLQFIIVDVLLLFNLLPIDPNDTSREKF